MKYFCIAVSIIATAFIFFAGLSFAGETAASAPVRSQIHEFNYSWAGRRMSGTYWGLAFGDVDGDGKKETILLKRDSVKIGRLSEKGFDEAASCELPGLVKGARIYSIDLDADSKDEIVVSGVDEGSPNSVVMSFKGGKCTVISDKIIWSLRVENKILLGQSWSSSDYFSGPIFEVKFENGKFREAGRTDVKKNSNIYQFAWVPPAGDNEDGVIMVKGYNPLEYYDHIGKKFKCAWRTGERFGGTVNLLPASQRDILGQVESSSIGFDVPPIVRKKGESFEIIVVRHDMPLRGVIGLKPAVSGAEIVTFVPDAALILNESMKTVRLPGAVTDMAIGEASDGAIKLFVLLQNNPGVFHEGDSTTILAFDLP